MEHDPELPRELVAKVAEHRKVSLFFSVAMIPWSGFSGEIVIRVDSDKLRYNDSFLPDTIGPPADRNAR
jgi:hypothetical protein